MAHPVKLLAAQDWWPELNPQKPQEPYVVAASVIQGLLRWDGWWQTENGPSPGPVRPEHTAQQKPQERPCLNKDTPQSRPLTSIHSKWHTHPTLTPNNSGKKKNQSQAWWQMPVIPAPGSRDRQISKFSSFLCKVALVSVSLPTEICPPACSTWQVPGHRPCLKNK